MTRTILALSSLIWFIPVLPATADDGRYQLEKSGDGYVRLDTETGEMSICKESGNQLVCRLAADERAAFQDEIDRLDRQVEEIGKRLTTLEADRKSGRQTLPDEDEFEKTLGYMERFMRRFMDIIEDHNKPQEERKADPDRT